MTNGTKTLFMAVPMAYARHVYRHGFYATPRMLYDGEALKKGNHVEVGVETFCEFRDTPPRGLTPSIVTDTHYERIDEGAFSISISGGAVLADDMGDLVLAIEVPDDEALHEMEVYEDPPQGWPFREYWLPPDVANRYRETLRAWIPESDEEVPLALLAHDHAVFITQRLGDPGVPVDAICVCGERWLVPDPMADSWHENEADFGVWLDAHSLTEVTAK